MKTPTTNHKPRVGPSSQMDQNQDQSSGSITSQRTSIAPTETETIINCNEPWDTYKVKIESLCHQLWPDSKLISVERLEGGASNRIVAVTILAEDGAPQAKHFLPFQIRSIFTRISRAIERQGHSYRTRRSPTLGAGQFILRIPRSMEMDEGPPIKHDKAALTFASKTITLPVPEVLHIECRRDNPIDSWYMVQGRIDGQPLDELWESLNHQQRLSAARQTGQVLKQLSLRHYQAAGTVDPQDLGKILALTTPGASSNRSERAKLGVHPVQFMQDRFEQWADQPNSEWRPYRAMAALLTKAAIGDDPNYYFNHGDFYPRNILVQVVDETNVRFTGILDWDNANFAPAFVAFDPPCWLWKFEEFTSGFLEGPNLRLGAAEEPQSIFDQEIKQVFEETVGREWLDVAYRKDAEVYRQIWQLMKEGVWSSVQLYLAEDAIEELTGAPYEQRLPRPTDEYVEDESDDEPDEVKERSTEHEVLHK